MPCVRRPSLLSLGLIGLLLIAGCSPEGPPASAPPTVVDSHVIGPGNDDAATSLTGRVRAAEQTSLSFEISGEIQRLGVDVGDRFAAGETLATLADERYRLVAEQRRAETREAEAVLREKRQDYRRQARLAEQGYVSATRLDAARAALDTARSRQASAQAALELAERDLALTTLAAPFDGSVSRRHAEPSERVAANQPVLEVISHREGFEVTTSVPETLIGALEIGSRHRILVPALGDVERAVTLRHLGSQPRSSNDYPLILTVEAPPEGLRSGMTARVELSLTEADGDATLPVPLTALVYTGEDQAHVLRIGGDYRLAPVEVEVVAIDGGLARVRAALVPGERIVARGAEFVHPGERVSVLGEGPERYH